MALFCSRASVTSFIVQHLPSRGRCNGAGRAGLDGFTFHGLRHSFVAILVAAGCNVREVSEWAGHNSVAFTLTRYGGLFEDGSNQAVDRLDALMQGLQAAGPVVELRRD